MSSKSTLSFLQSLKLKKYRQKYKKFTLENEKIIQEALISKNISVERLFCVEEKADLFKSYYTDLERISPKNLARVSSFKSPQGVLAVCNMPEELDHQILKNKPFTVYLDDISDPGNLGTILRTCEWFGVKNIVGSPNTAEFWNPKVLNASMGSFARVQYFKMEFDQLINICPDSKLVGADLNGVSLYEYKWHTPTILILGSESHGIQDSIKSHLDESILIPSSKSSKAESLNAAIALGIILSHLKL